MLSDDFRRVLRPKRGMIHSPWLVFIFGGIRVDGAAEIGLELGGSFAKIVPASEEVAPLPGAECRREFLREAGDGGGVGWQSLPRRRGPARQGVCED